jgi:hypothetical protein
MALYDDWCHQDGHAAGPKRYLTLTEKDGGREAVIDRLSETVRSHYERLDRIADDIDQLGYSGAAAILRELLPTQAKMRAGDLGEVLASELAEEMLKFEVPVRRMRFKDGREVPMRGDDFIGVNFCADYGGLWLLKGESKSRRMLGKTTITRAREALNRDDGRCTPISLLFVASRLMDSDDQEKANLGRLIRNEVGKKALARNRIDHALFTLSGNGPIDALAADYQATEAGRGHVVVNLHIEDYDDFIADIYERAGDLGND